MDMSTPTGATGLLALPGLTRADVDGAIPGFAEPRIEALLRSLPKDARRTLIPIRDSAAQFLALCTAGAAVSRSRTDAAQPTANSVIGGAVWLPVGNDTRIVDTPWVNTRDRRYLLQAAKFRLSRSMHSLQAHGSFTASMSRGPQQLGSI